MINVEEYKKRQTICQYERLKWGVRRRNLVDFSEESDCPSAIYNSKRRRMGAAAGDIDVCGKNSFQWTPGVETMKNKWRKKLFLLITNITTKRIDRKVIGLGGWFYFCCYCCYFCLLFYSGKNHWFWEGFNSVKLIGSGKWKR